MVGRRLFPFGKARPIFRGELLVLGSVNQDDFLKLNLEQVSIGFSPFHSPTNIKVTGFRGTSSA